MATADSEATEQFTIQPGLFDRRISQFLRYYAAIHDMPGAYGGGAGGDAHRASAERLYEQSVAFLGSLPWDRIGSALDIGCGYGLHCAEFVRRGARVVGLTVHIGDELGKHAAEHGYELVAGDMHFPPFQDGAFDLVWSSHSLEHSFSPLLCLREWMRVLKPGGWLAVSVPPHKSEVVSGHFTTGWTPGQLLYLLGVAGFDVADGRFFQEGYNVRGLVRRPETPVDPAGLSWLRVLRERLPEPVRDSMRELPNSLGGYAYEGDGMDTRGPNPS